jgi:hypothetical protein
LVRLHELAALEWLRDEIGRARLYRREHRAELRHAGQHDDSGVRVLAAQLIREIQSVHHRHVNVDERDVGGFLLEQL